MGLWSWLFGSNEPELEKDGNRLIDVAYRDGKRHGPYKRYRSDGSLLEEGVYVDGERDGPFVIHGREVRVEGTYRAGQLHGLHRVLKDGIVQEEREYVDGEVVRGPHEKRNEIRKDWVQERGTLVHGKRDGVWREYGVPRDGKKPLMKRCHSQEGILDGPYETWFYDGTREIEGAYRGDQRVGRWTYYRYDGSTQAELDYEDGAVARWRWLARDGSEREVVTTTDDDDLVRWLALGDAWDEVSERGTYGVEAAIDRWPADQRARPLAWLDERILADGRPGRWAGGDAWIELMTDCHGADPRTRYVDTIDVDHHDWDDAQTRRLRRFASQILELALVECGASPDISALFDVPWPKLTMLALHACYAHDEVIEKIYDSPIEQLELTAEPLSPTAVLELVNAPWLETLQVLRLTVENRDIVDLLATRAMPELRELELEAWGIELGETDARALLDRELRPTLARVRLNETDYSAISTK